MKLISDNIQNSHFTFTSGLNKKILVKSKNINIGFVQNDLLNHNIESDLNNNIVAFAVQQVLKIFDILSNKTNAKLFNINIPFIQTYIKENLVFDFQGYGFCIPQAQNVLKNKEHFRAGSLFFEEEENLELLNNKLDEQFQNNERSSSHYLAPFVHEFFHNVYLNYIYANNGDNTFNILSKLQHLTFKDNENKIITNTIGNYAAKPINQYHEVFAETFTKLICDSLSSDSLPKGNPLDKLKQLPQEFLIILAKLFNF